VALLKRALRRDGSTQSDRRDPRASSKSKKRGRPEGRPRHEKHSLIKYRDNAASAHIASRHYQVPLVGQSPRLVVLAAVHLCVNSPVVVRSTENVSLVDLDVAVTT
jgi:hypothetical protein